MTLNSINTNVAALRAQENIGSANRMSSSSIARLSSGNRIVRAADDVASMSAGTSLRTNVTTLRTALINTSQGSSLLQVADGALNEITDILLRQKAIAVQAGSGSLSASERAFLDQEFQNLTDEIDRLAEQTNFNGVTLLDGSLFEKTALEQNDDIAEQATASLTVGADLVVGNTIDLNGVTITPTTDFNVVAGDINATLQNMASFLNSSTNANLAMAEYSVSGNTLNITVRGGGTGGQEYVVDNSAAAAAYQVSGRLTNTADVYTVQGADNDGIAMGDVTAVGTIGDSIINTQNQTGAFATLTFATSSAVGDLVGDSIDISIGDNAGDVTFTAVANTVTPSNVQFAEVLDTDGTLDLEATLDSLVFAINNYSGNDDYSLSQMEARREGNNIILQKRTAGNVLQTDRSTALANGVVVTSGGGEITATTGSLSANGVDTGVSLEGISNNDFVGSISGFEVEYVGLNQANISLTVGERTYSANNVTVNVDNDGTGANPSPVFLQSAAGDYFEIDLMGATANVSVTDQSDADQLAERLDTAFSGLTFYQSREISSYSAAGDIVVSGATRGSLTGSSFSLSSSDFSDIQIDDVSVTAPVGGSTNASIEFEINGETYRSQFVLSDEIGANAVVNFVNQSNGLDTLTFRNGGTVIEINNSNDAEALEAALINAFGIGEGGESLNFQVGVTTADSLEINIGTVTTDELYSGQDINVLTQDAAGTAGDVLDAAIDMVTSVRADVGALQSRFDFAAANIESSLQNQDSARAVLLDTDVAAESTAFATAQVQLQAGISVLAQANLLQQNLLKLIG